MIDSSDTSKTQEEYLPQYILDILANRVALKLSYFGSKFNHKTMWYPVLKGCLQIEKNPLSIDSVILEAKKENDQIATNPTFTVKMFHTFYARIYVLLFYKYGTDPIYKECVFPELKNNMSIYASEKNMELIHKGVEEIQRFVKSFEKTANNTEEKTEQNDCQNQIGSLKKQIEGLKSENEKLKKESAEKDKEIAELIKIQNEYDTNDDDEDIEFDEGESLPLHKKVSFEFFIKLLEKVEFDINNTGNKTNIGTLWYLVTGNSAEYMRRYTSDRDYDNKNTKADIKRLNMLLKDMKIPDFRF